MQIVCGTRKSGKTSLLIKFLCSKEAYKNRFDRIVCFSTSISLDKKWRCIDFAGWEVYEHFHESVISNLEEHQRSTGAQESVLVICDDMGSEKNVIGDRLDHIATVGRHLNVSLIFLCQRLAQTTTTMRSQFSSIILFPSSATRREIHMLCEDVALDPSTVNAAMRTLQKQRVNYSFVNLVRGNQGFIEMYINYKRFDYRRYQEQWGGRTAALLHRDSDEEKEESKE